LFVTKLASHSPTPAPDAVLLLTGGPGDTPDLEANAENPVRNTRDLYVLDQRGTGRSQPSLACPEVNEVDVTALGLGSDDPSIKSRFVNAARACRKRLTGEGIRLSAYNTAESASDVADLRQALGIREWNLAGGSYGTRLALVVLRDHPKGVRSVALGGPYPPQVDDQAELLPRTQNAFDVLFDRCAADAACRATSPDLRATFDRLVTQLDAQPVTVTVSDPATGRATPIRFDGQRLPVLLRGALYDTSLIPALPAVIEQLAAGQGFDTVAGLVIERVDRVEAADKRSWGMYYSVHCQEEIAFTDRKAGAAAARKHPQLRALALETAGLGEICRLWKVGRAPARENQPVRSSVPALVLVGAYDPATPPAWARLAAKTLSRSYVFEFPDVGHDVTMQACPRQIRNAFFDDPTRKPSDPCFTGS
jgi:pimeloyl-ACP methyl ester carboxylesterase